MNDMIFFGDAVKALDDKGRVGGYLIRFGDAEHKDLDGDYFDAQGYYGPNDGDGAECLFDHGYPVPADRYKKNLKSEEINALIELSERTFQPIKTKRDAVGIFAETVLNLEDEYEKFIHSRVTKGKIGWSSGAPAHRVRRDKDGKITKWTIAEGSLTPRPAEPLNRVVSMKSVSSIKFVSLSDQEESEEEAPTFKPTVLATRLTKHIGDIVDAGTDEQQIISQLASECGKDETFIKSILSGSVSRPSDANLKAIARVLDVSFDVLRECAERDGAQTIKGMFEAAVEAQTLRVWQLFDIYCQVICKIANVAQAARQMGEPFDVEAKVKEATEEFSSHLNAIASGQVAEYTTSGDYTEPFYLKAIINPESDPLATESVNLENHSQLVESALKGFSKRCRKNFTGRIKAGRTFSQRNRDQIGKTIEGIEAQIADLRALLEESQPMATEEEKNAAQIEFLRLQTRTNRLGVNING